MLKRNQKGAVDIFLVLTLLIVMAVGGFVVYRIMGAEDSIPLSSTVSTRSDEESTEDSICTIPEGWETYEDSEFGYSYSHPAEFSVSTVTDEIDGSGNFGSKVANAEGAIVFTIEALVWSDGALYGSDSTEAINSAFDAGGIDEVASVSHNLNVSDDNPNLADDSTGDLATFETCGSSGRGFSVTGDFTTGFVSVEEGGTLVDEETTIVYVAGDGAIYRVKMVTSSADAATILTTLNP